MKMKADCPSSVTWKPVCYFHKYKTCVPEQSHMLMETHRPSSSSLTFVTVFLTIINKNGIQAVTASGIKKSKNRFCLYARTPLISPESLDVLSEHQLRQKQGLTPPWPDPWQRL